MKYIKTYENLYTAKNKINDIIIDNIDIELVKTYLNNGDKEYYYIINEKSKIYTANIIIYFIETLFSNQLNIDIDEILSFLDEITIYEDKLNENSIKSVTQEIYNYINEYSNYNLEHKFKFSQTINKYNL